MWHSRGIAWSLLSIAFSPSMKRPMPSVTSKARAILARLLFGWINSRLRTEILKQFGPTCRLNRERHLLLDAAAYGHFPFPNGRILRRSCGFRRGENEDALPAATRRAARPGDFRDSLRALRLPVARAAPLRTAQRPVLFCPDWLFYYPVALARAGADRGVGLAQQRRPAFPLLSGPTSPHRAALLSGAGRSEER